LIYHCDAFVSNSFHGTVFSIIFNKPVFVFNRHRHKVNSRMESLLGLFGLSACLEPQDDYSFDWGKVNQIRLNERQKSIAYLQSILAV